MKPSWNLKKANWPQFTQEVENAVDKFKLNDNVDKCAKMLNKLIHSAALKTIPRGKRKDYTPYWTAELDALHKNLSEARNKMDEFPNDPNTIAHNKAKAVYYKRKNEIQRESWHEKTGQLNLEKDSTKLWNLTKSLNDEKSYSFGKTVLQQNGNLITGKQAANEFADFYKNISTTSVPKERESNIKQQIKDQQKLASDTAAMHDEITNKELNRNIRKLKNGKSPGQDGIMNEMIKHLGNKGKTLLLQIFNLSWKSGKVPSI